MTDKNNQFEIYKIEFEYYKTFSTLFGSASIALFVGSSILAPQMIQLQMIDGLYVFFSINIMSLIFFFLMSIYMYATYKTLKKLQVA